MKALVVARQDQNLSIDDAKSKLKLLCGGKWSQKSLCTSHVQAQAFVDLSRRGTGNYLFYLHSYLFVDKIRVKNLIETLQESHVNHRVAFL